MQTPITVTGPADVSVIAEMNRPGGKSALPKSSTFVHSRFDQSRTLRRLVAAT
jgi:hypothetical protein